MSARRSQEETLLNATSLAAASVCCWNFWTQIGVSAATTAVSAGRGRLHTASCAARHIYGLECGRHAHCRGALRESRVDPDRGEIARVPYFGEKSPWVVDAPRHDD